MSAHISIENLCKSFNGAPVLRNVNLEVKASELIVIIGPSGCGKSTLLRCMNGLELFDSGKICMGSITLERHEGSKTGDLNSRLRSLREEVGMVFQSFNLFPHLTLIQNVTKAPVVVKGMDRKTAEEKAKELLDKVGLGDRIDYYPSQLSGGQQQRGAIARALMMSPRVMLYDEPTSALDPSLVNEVLQIMRKLDEDGLTQIVVTHEMRFARDAADRIIFLSEGEVVEDAGPERFFTSPKDPRAREFIRSYL
ncbi:MAG TPA: amino acid ABC transporter ATP-binding protein [Blastocatellia bacterium]|jgi:polar amino acid transport system ATP-binding protein|nr:amino acid ABC transporter ATP-binding protein [Blastocatellia bacterium]